MRRVIVKDYNLIGYELEKIKSKDYLGDINLEQSEMYSINGHSSSYSLFMSYDVKVLSAQLIKYFELTNKNFEFNTFYDKKFMDLFKALVKDEFEFKKFLEMTGLSIEDFIHISIYIVPQCYTSNLIKYLKSTYLKHE